MARLTSLLLLSCFGLTACGSEERHDPQGHEHEEHEHREHEHAGAAALALDNGARWVMDDHSRDSFSRLKRTASTARIVGVADAETTAGELQAQLRELIAGCTMEGPAHDNLHVFLGMFIPAIDALEASTDVEAANTNLNEVRALLDEHGRFFE